MQHTVQKDEHQIKFRGVQAPQIFTNVRIAKDKYSVEVDDHHNQQIVNNTKIINTIDIDWNNVVVINNGTEILGPINTSADLINEIAINREGITLNNEYISDVQTSIQDIHDQLDTITEEIGDLNTEEIHEIQDDIHDIKEVLSVLCDSMDNLDIENLSNITDQLTELQTAISNINNAISDLNSNMNNIYIENIKDNYDIVRRSELENLKQEFQGESAYEIAKRIGGASFPYSTEEDWVASLKGDRGFTGKSAYEIARDTALQTTGSFPYANEQEWIEAIQGQTISEEFIANKVEEIMSQNQLTAGNGITIENNQINASANTWIMLQ